MTKKIWLVIEKNSYGGTTHSYNISKVADTIEKAYQTFLKDNKLNNFKNYII